MRDCHIKRLCAIAGTVLAVLACSHSIHAQTVTWGINGVGGNGNWTDPLHWYNGTFDGSWPTNGDAIFAGASGTVNSFFPGPNVSSMTFNTPGYVIQNGWIDGGTNGLTITTNADATVSSTLAPSEFGASALTKNGAATLTIGGTDFLDTLQLNQGVVRLAGDTTLFFSDVTLANAPGVAVVLGQSSTSTQMHSLSGGGTIGGIVEPDNEARTVTLEILGTASFAGTLQDNGSGILALDKDEGGTQTLTGVNTYSGATTVGIGTLALAGTGSALNTIISIQPGGTFAMDNSSAALSNRISGATTINLNGGTIHFVGNSTTAVNEVAGPLSLTSAANITVTQPGGAAAQLSFAGLTRNNHATLDIVGPGVSFAGLTNGSTGIVAPFVTAGNEWATIGGDGRITPFTAYAADINAASTTDHVKITATGTTSLANTSTRASLNLQNGNASTGQVLNLSGQSLTLTSGGILSSGAGNGAISNGMLSSTSPEMVVTTNNDLAIGANIINGSGATTLTKTGPGTLTLTGANSYTGLTALTQGTLVVSSDANLGQGTTIELGTATLRAAADFTSTKGFVNTAQGVVDTAGFNVTFSGPHTGTLEKAGLGSLTLSNPVLGSVVVTAGELILPPNVFSGGVFLNGGSLQAAGTLPNLNFSSQANQTLDIGGPGAATLTTDSFGASGVANLTIDFGIGGAKSDLWVMPGFGFYQFPSTSGALQFEFQNLGGLKTGVDYPLISSQTGLPFPPSASIFAFAPDMAAAGWAGTFDVTFNGVSVRFTSVPEPGTTALLLLQGVVLVVVARRRMQKR